MVLGSCAMAMHYHAIHKKFLFCPVPIAFGQSGTGKTTAGAKGGTLKRGETAPTGMAIISANFTAKEQEQ